MKAKPDENGVVERGEVKEAKLHGACAGSLDGESLAREASAQANRLFEGVRNAELEGDVDVICTVPKALLAEFEDHVVRSQYPGGSSEAMCDLIRRAVLKKRPRSKFPYYPADPGRLWGIPRGSYIIFTLSQHELDKLRQWLREKDSVEVMAREDGEVLLFNETRLGKLRETRKLRTSPKRSRTQ